MHLRLSLLLTLITLAANAQKPYIQMEQSNTTASFRGIHAAGPGVAWASGTNGTVVRTEDAGFEWQGCAMPPGAEKLDFRGIWAWDAMTAIVMSSGPGDQSRLYKTTDGCATWKLLLANTDKDGFWDSIAFADKNKGYLLGDPVNGSFVLQGTVDGGLHWLPINSPGLAIGHGKLGAFAASNSVIDLTGSGNHEPWFATGSSAEPGPEQGPFVVRSLVLQCRSLGHQLTTYPCRYDFTPIEAKLAQGSEAAGVFSLATRWENLKSVVTIAVGGDYKKPDETSGTAAWRELGQFHPSTTPPHGYRSAVAWDPDDKAWITAGPNGTDFSRDDGRTWLPLENGNWNAISLPYLVGPSGRIGKLVSLPEVRGSAGQSPGPAGQNAHSTKQ